jgi:hypothetical protein
MLLRHANQCEHACGQHAAFLGRTSYDPNLDRKRSQLDTGRHGDRCREASTGGSALGAQGCDNYRRQSPELPDRQTQRLHRCGGHL